MSSIVSPLPTARKPRFVIPLGIILLTAAGMGWAILKPELDNNIRLWVLWLLPITAGSLVTFWLLLSSFSRVVKGRVLVALVVASAAFALLFRVEGSISGSGLPNFVWRWSQRSLVVPADASGQLSAVVASQEVTQFLGKSRTGVLPEPEFHTDWVAHPPRELWRHSIGAGWSAFCVIGGRAITQEQRGEEEWVSCYDLGSGGLLWKHADRAHFQEWQSGEGPRATPTHEDGVIYTQGATGIVNALQLETGKLLWSRNVLADAGAKNLTWGLAASPLIQGEHVIVAGGDSSGPSLLAYEKSSGQLRWKTGQESASYASPMLAQLCGSSILLSQCAKSLAGHDPATGQLLFSHLWGSDKMPKCSQPVVVGDDQVFVSAGYQMGCEMVKLSRDSKGVWTTTTLWQNMKMKTQFNSVTLRDGHLYGLDDGSLACLDAGTGQRLWKEGRYGSGQHLLLGDVAVIQAERGALHLVKVSPQGVRELAVSPMLRGKTWNYPTVAGRHLLVRNDQEVAAYELAPANP
jgi:outer membrane protein assembly factor BamB